MTPWRVIVLLIAAGVVSAFQVGKVPGVLPMLRADLELTLFGASWIISMLNVIGAAAGVMMGVFADRIGYRRLIVAGMSLMALGCLAGGLTSDVRVFFISRFLEGIGFFFTILSAPSLIARMAAPRHLRLVLGLWGAYMPSGITVMLLISPFMVNRLGWRGLWLVNAFICLVVLGLFVTTAMPRPHEGKPGKNTPVNLWGNLKTILTTPGLMLLGLCFLCYAGQWMALMSFLPTFFMEEVGMAKEGAALWTALAVLVNIPGNISGGFLSQKNVPRWMVLSAAFVLVTTFTVGLYSPATPLTMRILLCLGFSLIGGLIPGTLLSAVPFHAPGRAYMGAANGLLMQGSNMGTLLMAPALAAVVGWFGGWHGAPWMFAAAGLVGLSAALGIGWIEKAAVSARQAHPAVS